MAISYGARYLIKVHVCCTQDRIAAVLRRSASEARKCGVLIDVPYQIWRSLLAFDGRKWAHKATKISTLCCSCDENRRSTSVTLHFAKKVSVGWTYSISELLQFVGKLSRTLDLSIALSTAQISEPFGRCLILASAEVAISLSKDERKLVRGFSI